MRIRRTIPHRCRANGQSAPSRRHRSGGQVSFVLPEYVFPTSFIKKTAGHADGSSERTDVLRHNLEDPHGLIGWEYLDLLVRFWIRSFG